MEPMKASERSSPETKLAAVNSCWEPLMEGDGAGVRPRPLLPPSCQSESDPIYSTQHPLLHQAPKACTKGGEKLVMAAKHNNDVIAWPKI